MDYDEQQYAEYLNELYGEVDICGTDYAAGLALFEVDPIAFRVGMADWLAENEDDADDDPNGGDGEDD